MRADFETASLPFADGTSRYAVMNEVFEHLRIDLIATMEEVPRVMAPGALLMLSTPNLFSYRGLRNLLLHRRAWAIAAEPYAAFTKLRTLGHMGHVREYTPRELRDFLSSVGFDVERVVHRGTPAGRFERTAVALSGRLRPYVSILARRRP